MLNGKRSLSPELAMMMEAALGVDAAPLLAMQNEYDMLMAERDDSVYGEAQTDSPHSRHLLVLS